MNENLQEFYELLKDEFPKVSDSSIYKILFSLLERLKKHGNNIGFSRYECDKFWVSEKTLRNIIEYLRDMGILDLSYTTISTNEKRVLNREVFKCNVYKVSDSFLEMILSFQRFVKNTWKYIDPVAFMKQRFKFIEKRTYYKFKHNNQHYVISKYWRFAWKIFHTEWNEIISPLSLQ